MSWSSVEDQRVLASENVQSFLFNLYICKKSLCFSEQIWEDWTYKLLFCDSHEIERAGIGISFFQVV